MLPIFCALSILAPLASLPPIIASGDVAPQIAGDTTLVAIAPIAFSEIIPGHTRTAVRAALGEAVQKTAPNTLLLDVDAECQTRECAIRQAGDANAEFLLELRVTLEQRDYAIEIVLVGTHGGEDELVKIDAPCRLCAQAELLAEIATQVTTLQATLERSLAVEAALVDAHPTDEPTRRPAGASGLRIGGWVSFALGLAGAGVGIALIEIDGREHGPTCEVDVRDINGACPNLYTTKLAGQISVGLGSAAVVTGVGLLIASGAKRDRKTMARIGPAAGGLRVEF